MKINGLFTFLPCSSLDELRLDRRSEEAEELLSAITALWHPALIAAAKAVPGRYDASEPPEELSGELVLLPECCRSYLPETWLDRAESSGAVVLQNVKQREKIISDACTRLELNAETIAPELAADFLALGYCRFAVEWTIRKHHYWEPFDEENFRETVLAAAEAALQGNDADARGHLQAAFDRLHETREQIYPFEPRLIDLTLAASTTLGEPLEKSHVVHWQGSKVLPRHVDISSRRRSLRLAQRIGVDLL